MSEEKNLNETTEEVVDVTEEVPEALEAPESPVELTEDAEVAEEAAAVEEETSEPEPEEPQASEEPAEPVEVAAPAAETVEAAAPPAEPVESVSAPRTLSQTAWIAICCAALILGLVVGRFVLGGSPSASGDAAALAGKIVVSEQELEAPLATFTYKGTTEQITVRDAIMANGSLEQAMDEQGNYYVPSADSALSIARSRIVELEAQSLGISATDEDVVAYAEKNLGTSDLAALASSYSMEEERLTSLLRSSATIEKVRAQVLGEDQGGTMPEAPTAPASEADAAKPTADYAAYIINLAGDEWDAAKGTWASSDGDFATALSNYEITAEAATYEAAQVAYYVAYQIYSQQQSQVSLVWTDYVNGLMSNANISIWTLTI